MGNCPREKLVRSTLALTLFCAAATADCPDRAAVAAAVAAAAAAAVAAADTAGESIVNAGISGAGNGTCALEEEGAATGEPLLTAAKGDSDNGSGSGSGSGSAGGADTTCVAGIAVSATCDNPEPFSLLALLTIPTAGVTVKAGGACG